MTDKNLQGTLKGSLYINNQLVKKDILVAVGASFVSYTIEKTIVSQYCPNLYCTMETQVVTDTGIASNRFRISGTK